MKIRTSGIQLIGTVAELRRVHDALVLVNSSAAREIWEEMTPGLWNGHEGNDDYDPFPDDREITAGYNTRKNVEDVLRAIRALSIDVEET